MSELFTDTIRGSKYSSIFIKAENAQSLLSERFDHYIQEMALA
jgi:hypothetical protein